MGLHSSSMPLPTAIANVPLFSMTGNPLVFAPGATPPAACMPQHLPPPPVPAPVVSMPPTAMPALSPGGTLVPPKLAQRIWKGEFVEMLELSPEKLGQPEDKGEKGSDADKKRKRKRVASILQWVECFHTYIGVAVQQQPTRIADLLAYASLIVHAARKFKGEGWVQYDRNFRKHAETHPGTRWAEANTTLWTLAFCNAQPRPHCELCFSLEHETRKCEEYEPPEEPKRKAQEGDTSSRNRGGTSGRMPICVNWNRSSCTSTTCSYQHICLECHARHKERDCPITGRRQYAPNPKRQRRSPEEQPFRKKGGSS